MSQTESMLSRYQRLSILEPRISLGTLDVRCLFHVPLALTLSLLWWAWARPLSGWVELRANTVEFWFGLFLLVLALMVRAARFSEKALAPVWPSSEDHLQVWFCLSLPYLLEALIYSSTAFVIGLEGGLDTLTTPRAPEDVLDTLLVLAVFVPLIGTLGATILGWKLSRSEVPAALLVLALGSLTVLATPCCYRLSRLWRPHSFPLLQVCLVAVAGLSLLLCLSRWPGPWLRNRSRPEPALLTAGLLPIAVLFALVFAVVAAGAGSPREIATFFLVTVPVAILGVSPALTLVWLKPAPCPDRTQLVGWAFLIGSLSHLGSVTVAISLLSPDFFLGDTRFWSAVAVLPGLVCAALAAFHRQGSN